MKIKKIIELEIERQDNNIVCNDLPTLCLICGSKAVSGNLSQYGTIKKGNQYFVNINFLKKRIKILEERRNSINNSLDIIKQVIRS